VRSPLIVPCVPPRRTTARQIQSYGWDARIEEFQVLWPSPKSSRLELLGPKPYVAKLREPPLKQDSTSSQTKDVLRA
jgi:N-acetylated-alpha-linked acidic dipeptidase